MSTRSTINFGDGKDIDAKIYRHSDGYPGTANGKEYGVLIDLRKFFDEVKRQTRDTRFGDASYLAAKFVAWQSRQNARGNLRWDYSSGKMTARTDAEIDALINDKYLDFLSVGVMSADPDDIEYTYFIDCSKTDANGYPKVQWSRAGQKRRNTVVYPVRPDEGVTV